MRFLLSMLDGKNSLGPLEHARISFLGIPQIGTANGFLDDTETPTAAIRDLRPYLDTNLGLHTFYLTVATMEKFLSATIAKKGATPAGTFGQIQRSAQKLFAIPECAEIEDLDEVRERRNVLIHRRGAPDDKWRTAALKVHPRAASHIEEPATAVLLSAKPKILSYAADVMLRYSRRFPQE